MINRVGKPRYNHQPDQGGKKWKNADKRNRNRFNEYADNEYIACPESIYQKPDWRLGDATGNTEYSESKTKLSEPYAVINV